MPQELESLAALIESPQRTTIGGRTFATGTLWGQDVVLAFSRWGKVAAAATTAQVLLTFNPTRVVFSGIAGSLRDDLNIGDVVIARRLYQHDLDASPFFAPMHIPLLDIAALPTDDALSHELNTAAQVFLSDDLEAALGAESSRFDDTPRRTIIADVATGDQIIASKEARTRVRRAVPTAACVEMEGAAAAQVCFEHGVPFACVRVISDRADETLHQEDITKFAALAGRYTTGILRRWFNG